MATSYGSITIVDITDIGEFSVYPKANKPKTQIYDPNGNTYTPEWSDDSKLIIEPVAYYAGSDVSSQATFTWQRREGAGSPTPVSTGETVKSDGTLEINQNVLGSSTTGIITYIVTAAYTIDGVNLSSVGEIEFSLVRQGNVAKFVKITGSNVFKYDTTGSIIGSNSITLTGSVSGVSIQAWQYKNGNQWSTYPNSTTSASLTVSSEDSVFSNDTVTIRLLSNDNNIYDLFTITKLRDGAVGAGVVSAVLTNEDQMIPADKNGNPTSFAGASTQLMILEGSTDVTSQWVVTKVSEGVTDSESSNTAATITGMSGDTGSVTFSCKETTSGPIKFTKKFSLVKVKTGQDGTTPTIYSLEPSSLVVNRAADGTPNPSSVTFNAYSQTGNTKTAYSGRIQFYLDNQSTIYDETITNSSSRSIDFTALGASVRKVRAVLYEAGANTNQLDSQTVVVTKDGEKGGKGDTGDAGISAVNLIIGNEADVIPCASDGHPTSSFTISIPFEGYQGITKKSTTATTVPTLSASTWGVEIRPVITQATSGVGNISYTIPTTATVPQSGQISLGFTVASDEGDVVINKMYSWTRSTNGANAVILQVVAEDGTIFDNNRGTLTAKALLYNGSTKQTTGVTYTWAQFLNGNYVTVGSSTPGVTANGDTITILASAVDGYSSFRVVASYGGNPYTQYLSFIDKADPIQISVHSTIGLQIKNSQGAGAMYARVTRNGTEIDPVPTDIKAGSTYPSSPVKGQKFIKLTGSGTTGTATLMNYNGTSWEGVTQTCTYEWTYRDKDNNVLTSHTPSLTGQFVYIDGDLIDGKITADVKVTVP